MTSDKSSIEVIEGVKELLTQLPIVSYGVNVMPYLNITNYGSGQQAYNSLKDEFNNLDLTQFSEFFDLDKKIKSQKKELKNLEKKHTNITEIIGDTIEGKEGSVASRILINLKSEIEHLIERRDELLSEIETNENKEIERDAIQKGKIDSQNEEFNLKTKQLEETYKKKEEELSDKINRINDETTSKINGITLEANRKVKEVENNATRKVTLINQFSDFLSETNDNMKLYSWVIISILVIAIVAIGFSIPNLLNIFESYQTFINSHNSKITNWQIINYSLGLLIIKLPWALAISAVLTGMYSLLKGLLITYEKINQDKRNMSAIYSISGNVAQSLNEYGIGLAIADIDDETGEEIPIIRVSRKELISKKENIRWNQIMKYFEGMQNIKDPVEQPEDETKLKLLSEILNKVIDKYPK